MDYETELQKLRDAQNKIANDQLTMTKNQQLGDIATQQAELTPKYQAQRQQANVSSQQQGQNFAEYLANRGLTNSGVGVQGAMNQQNLLNTNIGAINTNENQSLRDLATARTGVENSYASNLGKAQGENNLNYLQNIFNYKQALAEQKASAGTGGGGTITDTSKPTIGGSGTWGIIQNVAGDGKGNMIYTINNQQYQVKAGYNPFTGTKNPNISSSKPAFSNGYQPSYIGDSKLNKVAGASVTMNGQTQSVFRIGSNYYVWDGAVNSYRPARKVKGVWQVNMGAKA